MYPVDLVWHIMEHVKMICIGYFVAYVMNLWLMRIVVYGGSNAQRCHKPDLAP